MRNISKKEIERKLKRLRMNHQKKLKKGIGYNDKINLAYDNSRTRL